MENCVACISFFRLISYFLIKTSCKREAKKGFGDEIPKRVLGR